MVEHLNRKRDLNKNDKKAEHEILIDLFDNICELVSEKPKGVEFLNIDDVKAIKFSQLLSSCRRQPGREAARSKAACQL